jgi:hypothetical protein
MRTELTTEKRRILSLRLTLKVTLMKVTYVDKEHTNRISVHLFARGYKIKIVIS